jgi:hypothetical protein
MKSRISENGVSFFGAGGHSHDGVNSSLINTSSYSLFDFSPNYVGAQNRISRQQSNRTAMEDFIVRVVNSQVLSPAGITLEPNTLNGKIITANTITAIQIAANTITATQIAANTITANNIAVGTITGTQIANGAIGNSQINNVMSVIDLQSDFVTTNATMQSTVYTPGTAGAGWAINASGNAEFNNVTVRGTVISGDGFIGGVDINTNEMQSNGFSAGSAGFRISSNGNAEFNNVTVRGTVVSGAGSIGGWTINPSSLASGSTALYSNGQATFGNTTIFSNGRITNGSLIISASGALDATGAIVRGQVEADSGVIGGWNINYSLIAGTFGATSNYIDMDPDDGFFFRKWTGSVWGSGLYTDVKINYLSSVPGIDVTGNASGSTLTTEIRSSFVKSNQVLIGPGQNDVQTLLNGKAATSHTEHTRIRADAGTAVTPAYSFSTDTDSGMYSDSDGRIGFTTNGTLRARIGTSFLDLEGQIGITGATSISTSGNLSVSGTTSTSDQVFISASPTVNTSPALRVNRIYDSTGGYFIEFTNTGGTVRAGFIRYVLGVNNQVFYATSSDARLKELVNIEESMLDKIKQLNPTYYKWKNSDPNILFYGFTAQALHAVFPEAASEGDYDEPYIMEDGNINVIDAWGVDYTKLVPPLVKAMQELSAKVDSLESRLQALEGV